MRNFNEKVFLPAFVFVFSAFILGMVNWKVDQPMLLLERFVPGWGWLEIILVSSYGAWLIHKMKDPGQVKKWRLFSWTLFSVVFFSQLALGLLGIDECLMTGKLHLPVPAVILGGPAYRLEVGFMPILFISTIVLSGPAWCSHLCYLGALDGRAAQIKMKPRRYETFRKWKHPVFGLFILIAILLRLFRIEVMTAAIIAGIFGIIGLGIMLWGSKKNGAMMHCTVWCPVGTFINYARFINPFRLRISDKACTDCMLCTTHCRYDALHRENIKQRRPGISCTLCGDCLASCHSKAITYHFLGLNANQARNLYLFISVSIHTVFMALARL